MSVIKRFFRDAVIYGIAAVLPRVINFLLVRVHTDALPSETYAESTNFYIWAALIAIFLTFGFETAFFRFYKSEQNKGGLISTAFITIVISTLVFLSAALLFSDFFIRFFDFKNDPFQFKLFIGLMALDTLAVIPFAFLRASGRPVKYTLVKLVNVGVIVLINLLFLKFIPGLEADGFSVPSWLDTLASSTALVNYIFIANVIGSAVSLCMLFPHLIRFEWRFSFVVLRKMISYSWPIAIAGVAYVINENLDKLLIGYLLDKQTMGVYSACYKLAIFMNLYIMAFRLGAEPFFFNHSDQEGAKNTYARILNYFVIIGSVVFLGIVVFIDVLKALFINEAYWEAIKIVPVVLLANLFLGVYHNLAIWYKLTDKTRFAMYFSVLGALITIVLNVWLLPYYGFMVSAWATLAAYGSMMLISYFIGRKHYRVPYNLMKTGSYLISSILLTLISFIFFREHYLVSVLMVAGFGGLIYWNERRELIQIFKK